MKRFELGKKSYMELKDDASTEAILEATDFTHANSLMIKRVLEDLIIKMVIDDVEVEPKNRLTEFGKLSGKYGAPIITYTNRIITEAMNGVSAEDKKK